MHNGEAVGDEISVLMPIAPGATWLRQATDSLAAQTHRAWNLVAVLDGECEQNRSVLERDELKGRVRINVVPARSGVATALNLGLAEISTDLVARLDADDICEPERLATQLDVLRRRPEVLVVGSGATVIDEHGNRIGEMRVPTGPHRVRRRLLWRNALVHPSVMYRRTAVLAMGGYDPACARGQDYELWLRLAAVGQLDNVSTPLLRYRLHNGQHSRPLVGRDAEMIRSARRRVSRTPVLGPAYADVRHLAWLSYQHIQLRRRRARAQAGR